MPRKMTDEQRAKAAENLKKAREARAAKQAEPAQPEAQPTPTMQTLSPELKDELLLRLMREIDELKAQRPAGYNPEAALEMNARMQPGVNIGRNGLQGVVMRYNIEPSWYPNPTERLYDEPSLRRFGLRDNFFFDWKVEGVEWEKANITYSEPRFTCRIFRRMFAEDGVTPTGQMALINRMVLHEDEVVARIAADKLQLRDKIGDDFRELMDEVRFLRIRQWLLDLFSVPKVETHSRAPRQMVVDGKVVEMYDTEALIDGDDGKSKAGSVSRETRI